MNSSKHFKVWKLMRSQMRLHNIGCDCHHVWLPSRYIEGDSSPYFMGVFLNFNLVLVTYTFNTNFKNFHINLLYSRTLQQKNQQRTSCLILCWVLPNILRYGNLCVVKCDYTTSGVIAVTYDCYHVISRGIPPHISWEYF